MRKLKVWEVKVPKVTQQEMIHWREIKPLPYSRAGPLALTLDCLMGTGRCVKR